MSWTKKNPIRLLIVESDYAIAALIRDCLSDKSNNPFKISNAVSLKHAAHYLISNKDDVDLILLDLKLPDSDGLRTYAKIALHAKDIPIIVISHSTDPKIASDVYQKGAQVYLDKNDLKKDLLPAMICSTIERYPYVKATEEWKTKYNAAVKASRQLLYDWDIATNKVHYDGEFTHILGYKEEEMRGGIPEWIKRIHPQDRKSFVDEIDRVKLTGEAFDLEYRVLRKDGEYIMVKDYGAFSHPTNGPASRIIGFIEDISEKAKVLEKIKDREEHYRTLVSNIPGAVYRYKKKGASEWTIEYINQEIQEITGYPIDHFMQSNGKSFEHTIVEEDVKAREQAIKEATLSRKSFSLQYRIQHRDGKIRWISEKGRVTKEDGGSHLYLDGVIFDITQKAKAEEKVNYLSFYDSMTGLPNKTLFLDRLSQAIVEANRTKNLVAVFNVDLDHFKRINDTLGHPVGDKLIQMVAGRLSHVIYETDTATRFAGDEFLILLKGVKKQAQALKVADKVFNVFKTPFFIDGHELFMSCSIGISVYPSDGYDAETLLKNADTAKTRAKEQGRNNYQLYSPTMNNKALSRLKLENHLRHALERNQLRLHYQPQVDIKTGEIAGMEALLRWHHPKMGMIPPNDFIQLAEEAGLIIPIGEWVLKTACEQIREWELMGFKPIRVAVNSAASQLLKGDFVAVVSDVVRETQIDPDLLEIEMTESAFIENIDQTISTLQELRDRGIRIAIDDFGTGHSSLSRLKKFPITCLKIDQSFVKDIPNDPDNSAIAEAIISMGHSLNLEVIAEGVETKEQLAFLKSKGCDKMQGFLYSKPVPPQEFMNLLVQNKSRKTKSKTNGH